jgi:hypothetical protein
VQPRSCIRLVTSNPEYCGAVKSREVEHSETVVAPLCFCLNLLRKVGAELSDELKDQLRKLGLRVRPRTSDKPAQDKPGKIAFDARGNAVYEWSNDALAADSESGDRARNKALKHHGLSLVDDEPPANAPIQQNPKGLRVGYNPYESGLLANKERKKKTDLRELSKWVDMKRKLEKKTEDK